VGFGCPPTSSRDCCRLNRWSVTENVVSLESVSPTLGSGQIRRVSGERTIRARAEMPRKWP
jgi:hypothetical protein